MNGIDIETAGYEGGGALTPDEGELRLLQISDGKRADVYDAFKQSEETLVRAFEHREDYVAHNAPFERTWLNHALGVDLKNLDDTMVMSQVLYTGTNAARAKQFSHSLQAVVKRELKRDLDKTEQMSDWTGELTEEQVRYAARDAAVLPELASVLLRKIERAGLERVYDLELRVSHAVDQMERNVFGVDIARLAEFIEESTEQAERLKAEL